MTFGRNKVAQSCTIAAMARMEAPQLTHTIKSEDDGLFEDDCMETSTPNWLILKMIDSAKVLWKKDEKNSLAGVVKKNVNELIDRNGILEKKTMYLLKKGLTS